LLVRRLTSPSALKRSLSSCGVGRASVGGSRRRSGGCTHPGDVGAPAEPEDALLALGVLVEGRERVSEPSRAVHRREQTTHLGLQILDAAVDDGRQLESRSDPRDVDGLLERYAEDGARRCSRLSLWLFVGAYRSQKVSEQFYEAKKAKESSPRAPKFQNDDLVFFCRSAFLNS